PGVATLPTGDYLVSVHRNMVSYPILDFKITYTTDVTRFVPAQLKCWDVEDDSFDPLNGKDELWMYIAVDDPIGPIPTPTSSPNYSWIANITDDPGWIGSDMLAPYRASFKNHVVVNLFDDDIGSSDYFEHEFDV